MSKRTLGILIILLIVIGVIVFFARRKNDESATPVLSVSAVNQTKNSPATTTVAAPGDVIVYTLNAENQSDKVISGYIIQANLAGVTDKAALLDASGAQYNSAINALVWTPLDIPAHGAITKNFTVKISPLASGVTDAVLKISFNNELNISIAAPVVAGSNTSGDNTDYHAPVTGASDEIPWILALLTVGSVIAFKAFRLKKV